jgi:hypothetical protein
MNLHWAYTDSREVEARIYMPSVMPGTSRHCDVAHIAEPMHQTVGANAAPGASLPPTPVEVVFEVIEPLLKRTNAVRPGRYRLQVVIAADNARPISRWITIYSDGHWSSEETMLAEHLDVCVE